MDDKVKDKMKKGISKANTKTARQYVTIQSMNEEEMEDTEISQSSASTKVCKYFARRMYFKIIYIITRYASTLQQHKVTYCRPPGIYLYWIE